MPEALLAVFSTSSVESGVAFGSEIAAEGRLGP